MKKIVFLTSIIFHIYQASFAQISEISLSQKSLASEIIVECKVLDSESYLFEGRVYTSHKMGLLNSIYPQYAPCELIENPSNPVQCFYITTRGGNMQDRVEVWAEALNLTEGDLGLFFLIPSSYPSLHFDLPTYEVYSEKQGFVKYSLDNNLNFIGYEPFKVYDNVGTDLISPIKQELQISYGKESITENIEELVFRVSNLEFSNSIVSFDIEIKAVWGAEFSMKNAELTLTYPEEFFGSNLLDNGKFEVLPDFDFQNSGVDYQFTQIDSDKISILLEDKNGTDDDIFIGNQFQKIGRLNIVYDILNFEGEPNVELTISQPMEVADKDGHIHNVNQTRMLPIDIPNFNCEQGGIDQIHPLQVAAGVLMPQSMVFNANQFSGILTIEGCGFGDLDEDNLSDNIPFNNRVLFQTTVVGDLVTPFASDYIRWDDDLIIVRVPSIGYRQNQMNGLVPQPIITLAADFGQIQVITPTNQYLSQEAIEVEFVHWNDFNGDNTVNHVSVPLRFKSLDHFSTQANNNGYEFFFSEDFIDNMPNGSESSVNQALNTWCESRANLEIVPEAAIEEPNFAFSFDYGVLPAGISADALSILNKLVICESNDRPIAGGGITFSSQTDFRTDIDLQGTHDLESVALHELGHCHGLGHVSENTYVMHASTIGNADRDLSAADISGGQHCT